MNLSPRSQDKLDSLKYRSNVSPENQAKMKILRAKFYDLAEDVLLLGDSRETSEAFTCLETGLQFTIKHLCLTDPQATPEDIEPLEQPETPSDETGCCGKGCEDSNFEEPILAA